MFYDFEMVIKKIIWAFIVLLTLSGKQLLAQQEPLLPKWLTEEEAALIPSYLEQRGMLRNSGPPPWMPRAMAEWEELEGVLITWAGFPTILTQIVEHAQKEAIVYIVTLDSQSVKNTLANAGLPLTNIKFVLAPYNSIWCRDYGPWTIYRNDVEERAFADWIYNRPRPDDDVIPQALAAQLGIACYEAVQPPDDLVHTGGNFMVDGHGTGFSSELILNENGPFNGWNVTVKNKAAIDTIMKKYLGLNRYILMETLPYDAIHHIDMHMKLLDEETLLVGEFPPGVSDGPQLEANLKYVLDNFLTCYGRPYRVVRVPMVPSTTGSFPPDAYYRTYTNAVFVNKTLLVPTYREEYDTTALRIIREALPGYKVVGIDCDNTNAPIIAGNGAIHCITKEIGHSDPVWISHAPVLSASAGESIPIVARLRTPSGIEHASISWTTDTAKPYISLPLIPMGNDSFYAYLPPFTEGTAVYYYISAMSYSGRLVHKPLTAPQGYWKFVVGPGTVSAAAAEGLTLFAVYPNPAREVVRVGLQSTRTVDGRLLLFDALGRLVCEQKERAEPQQKVVPLPLRCRPGSYVLVWESAESRRALAVMVQ
ncbi:MAG: agmatine deiminase family protein [Chitinophagales bacterium]|nr:agmatine deiminase family protein [Chitinophagales bacterium]MDW8427204.1 agmatine deiminase family protein [Chitinophagales bacterium]